MTSHESLHDRVMAFKCYELPGQPMSCHMGTSYLVNDLWEEVKKLRELLLQAANDGEYYAEYAGEYLVKKHRIAEEIVKYRAAALGEAP